MRTTRLVDDQGRVWTISNGDIVSVLNHSRRVVRSSVDVVVAADHDVAAVRSLVDAEGARLYAEERGRLRSAPRTMGVSAFDQAQTTLRVEVTSEPDYLADEQLRVREAICLCLRDLRAEPRDP